MIKIRILSILIAIQSEHDHAEVSFNKEKGRRGERIWRKSNTTGKKQMVTPYST